MTKLIWVGLGGGMGAMCRYGVSGFATRLSGATVFPVGTMAVNLIGCFVIGMLGCLMEMRQIFSPQMRLLVMTGFLGGFTTFSTYGLESFTLFRTGAFPAMLCNIFVQTVGGLICVWAGYIIARMI